MSEAHAELQQIVSQYDRQLVAATRAQREAEIVLSFLRAALEELKAVGQADGSEIMNRAQTPVQPESNIGPVAVEAPPIAVNGETPFEPKPAVNRGSIAKLIEDVSERMAE